MGALAGGVIAGGSSLIGGLLGRGAANKSAEQIANQLRNALTFQQGVYGTATNNLQPYATAGNTALQSYLGALGLGAAGPGGVTNAFNAYTQTPAYQFALGQGQLGLNRQLASMGLTGSGAALKDATAYNQGYASQNFQNYLAQILGLAQGGQQAAGTLGQIGTGIGQLNLSANQGIGSALGAGTVGANNALNGGLQGLIGSLTSPANSNPNLLQNAYNWFSNNFGGAGGGSGSSYSTGPSSVSAGQNSLNWDPSQPYPNSPGY